LVDREQEQLCHEGKGSLTFPGFAELWLGGRVWVRDELNVQKGKRWVARETVRWKVRRKD